MEKEHREERPLLGAAERDRLPILVRLERAEDPKVDHRTEPGSAAPPANTAITRHFKPRSTLSQGHLKRLGAGSSPMSIRHGLVVVLVVSAIVVRAGNGGAATPVAPQQPVIVKVSDEGFQWLDAGLGAAAAIAASFVVLGLVLTVRQSRPTRQEGSRNEGGTHAQARS
jgi:hypothetical protein